MDKRKIQIIAASSVSGFALMGTLVASIAWFVTVIKINNINGTGYTDSAYFAYGTGTENDPFGISEVRHLNNLAWLQYNGNFDSEHFYFELANDINVDGSQHTMPPIGTETHPFIGVFNGNGYTINNIKVTNDVRAFTKKPHNITYTQSDAEVVGFFGVVGSLDGEAYTSSTNSLHDVTLDNLTIESKTTNTLIGLTAGFVNADMSGVKVGTSTIKTNGNSAKTAYTDKLSDYGLVGYTTKTGSVGTFEQKLSQYYNSNSQGDDPGWGGSIVIKDFYERLTTIRSNYSRTNSSVPMAYTDTYDPLGNLVTHTGSNNNTVGLNVYNENETKNGVTYNSKIGALQTYYQNNNNGGGIYYLSGGHYLTNNYSSYYSHSGYPIVSGAHYLQLDTTQNNNLSDVQSPASPTLWTMPADGNSGYISTTYKGTTYYLRNNNGTLTTATAAGSATSWTVSIIDGNWRISSGSQGLDYSNGWVLKDMYYYIISYTASGTTRYLKSNGGNTSVTTTATESEAAKWGYDSGQYFLNSGDYLGIECSRSGTLSYTLSVSKPAQAGLTGNYKAAYTFSTGEGTLQGTSGTFSASVSGSGLFGLGSTTFYLTYSGATLSADTSAGNTFTVKKHSLPSTVTKGDYISDQEGPDYHTTSTTSGMEYSKQDTTYLPLTVDANLEPKNTNTGYIVGGSAYASASSSYDYGNVRIASFYTIEGNLRNYNSSSKQFNANSVWTYDSTGLHNINDENNNFVKYAESKGKIEQTLGEGNNIYGLHFMTAAINKNNAVEARYAMINGEEFTNYQMPANAIDFNLKEQGYVNFFAAPYGNDSNGNARTVDSFFSLHMMKRNGSAIDDIYEIEQVYSDDQANHSYVYKLSNGMYTIPYSIDKYNPKKLYILNTKTPITDTANGGFVDGVYHQINQTTFSTNYSGYQLKFDMDWIKNHSYADGQNGFHEAFYFEIPTNPGEYALGTVANKTFGAYLMYLDIAANAANRDTITSYAITTFQSGSKYPSGVDFATSDVAGDLGGETLAIIIFAGNDSDGDIDFTVSGTSIAYAADFDTQYAYSEKAVSGNDPPEPATLPPSTGTRLIYTHILTTDYQEWDIIVTDILDANGDATSSSITSVKCDGDTVTAEDIPDSFIINSIRPQVSSYIATFTRLSGTNEFSMIPTYSGEDYKTVALTIDMNGTTLSISNLASGYSFSINGVSITTDPQQYPAS